MLDITTTATIRPELFHQTLDSFTKNLFVDQKEYRLILNVDPIGEDVDPMEVVKVGQQFFDNVVYNIPNKPNFAQACKWCWGQTTSKYIFHLEDDWELSRKILIGNLISILDKDEIMVGLRLPKNRVIKVDPKLKKIGYFINYKLVLNPILYRGDFIRDISGKMDIENNPERQLRTKYKLFKKRYVGIYCGEGDGTYIRHHGRVWQRASNYKKRKGSNFVTWEKRA